MQYQANRPGAGALLGASPLVQASADGVPDLQAIERSHQRSSSYGITRGQRPDLDSLSRADLAQTLEANQALSGHARPVMETLYDQIRNTHSMVILSDAEGTILHTLGFDHTKLTFPHSGRNFRLTDVHGEVVKGLLA